jgi:hypothetical protein
VVRYRARKVVRVERIEEGARDLKRGGLVKFVCGGFYR